MRGLREEKDTGGCCGRGDEGGEGVTTEEEDIVKGQGRVKGGGI